MYRNLDSISITKTIETLHNRINERFPDSGLGKVCAELANIARETEKKCEWITKPHLALRIGVYMAVAFILIILFRTVVDMKIANPVTGFLEFIQFLEAGMNSAILIGASILFLVTIETRVKRSRALKAIHELRSLTHVIDIHQLTKDPERTLGKGLRTASSPKSVMNAFQLIRYLDYSSEMLSLTGKVAALYAQGFSDPVVLSAVSEVENLSTGLSRKIWQKIMILHTFDKNNET